MISLGEGCTMDGPDGPTAGNFLWQYSDPATVGVVVTGTFDGVIAQPIVDANNAPSNGTIMKIFIGLSSLRSHRVDW
jgi:hypothetical protein